MPYKILPNSNKFYIDFYRYTLSQITSIMFKLYNLNNYSLTSITERPLVHNNGNNIYHVY